MKERSTRKYKIIGLLVVVMAVIVTLGVYLHRHNLAVLDTKGRVGDEERNLLILASLLAIIVVVPVYAMTIGIAWKYREGNHRSLKRKYSPDWDHSRFFEGLWWAVPTAIIVVLAVVVWNSSHNLDPYRGLASTTKPLPIEVVALDWKWLFIYPQQNIASVQLAEIPVNTPVVFYLTSDTVMNSFWVPNLGGQIYAMPGMSTELHLVANITGNYPGSSANISGSGFAGMTFTAKAVSARDFTKWVGMVKQAPQALTMPAYQKLASPATANTTTYYATAVSGLYNYVIMKYMDPNASMPSMGLGMSGTSSQPAATGPANMPGMGM